MKTQLISLIAAMGLVLGCKQSIENTSQKFLPGFTFDDLRQAALTSHKNGAFKAAYADLPPLATEANLAAILSYPRSPGMRHLTPVLSIFSVPTLYQFAVYNTLTDDLQLLQSRPRSDAREAQFRHRRAVRFA